MPWGNRSTRTDRHAAPVRRNARRIQPADRARLEAAGWRTTLEYRENHVRGIDGVLDAVEVEWRAECERSDEQGSVDVLSARGSNPAASWRRLRAAAEDHERQRVRWVRQRSFAT